MEVETDLIFLPPFSPTSQDPNQEIPIVKQNHDQTVEHQNTSNDAVKNINNVTTNVSNEESEIVQQPIVETVVIDEKPTVENTDDLFMATYKSLEDNAKDSECQQEVTYHMHNFFGPSLDFDAQPDLYTKLRAPTVKERSVGILNILTRKINVALGRNIFTLLYYIIYDLHPHKTSTKMHFSQKSIELINLL